MNYMTKNPAFVEYKTTIIGKHKPQKETGDK